jgi:hypothetical protein
MKDELLLRLESFEIDMARVAFPFSARLARENGWSRGFARRVMDEYKRFVWLAMQAGHPVTPSEEVDEAWHLHMIYTRSYWEEMCGEILRKPLHHGPTAGGAAEEAKFTDWYDRTLDSYRHHFGAEPPTDIWPPSEKRFAARGVRKVDPASHWIVPKRLGGYAILGGALPLLAGCSGLLSLPWNADTTLSILILLFIVVLVVIALKRKGGGRDCGSGCGSGGCSTSSGCGASGCGSSGCSSSGCSSSGCGSSGCGGGGGD